MGLPVSWGMVVEFTSTYPTHLGCEFESTFGKVYIVHVTTLSVFAGNGR
jgi:hypothetical protein